jgi:hypothetical protein
LNKKYKKRKIDIPDAAAMRNTTPPIDPARIGTSFDDAAVEWHAK